MKKILAFLFLTSLVVVACKKPAQEIVKCETQTEINDTNHQISFDFSTVAPDIIDTLNKYPQLQIHSLKLSSDSIAVLCNVFHQGIQIFGEEYRLVKNIYDNQYLYHDTITTDITIDLIPTKNAKESIRIAESVMNYEGSCITYQLGVFDINKGVNGKNYKLVWRVSKEKNNYPIVILDAHTGKTYFKDSGEH